MTKQPLANFDFLAGKGMMRTLMREHDWSNSPLGPPHQWSAALRTVAGLMLDSQFPMFVAWGPDLGFLYNDAYIEVLGAKHPQALGGRFHDIWEEIWPVISPLIDHALAGEASFHENLPLLMQRKGHEEQTWFTFSYSPARDENGRVAGMFCACTETTGQILAERRQAFELHLADLLRGMDDPLEIIEASAGALGRHLEVARVGYGEIDAAGQHVLVARDWTDGSVASLAGKSRPLESFGPDIIAELKAGHTLRLDDMASDPRSAPYAQGYASIGVVSLLVIPLIKAGRMKAILYLHEPQTRHWTREDEALAEQVAERTWATIERARAEERRRQAEEALSAQLAAESDRLRTLFEQAPGFMAVLRGPQHVFELANAAFLRFIGRQQIIGKPVREALPDLETQPFFGQLDRVYATGEPFFAQQAPVTLALAPGREAVERYVDFIYQPVRDAAGNVSGIFVEGYDVTERKLADEALRAADRRKDEFLAMLAHELRNPLAPISNAAQILRIISTDQPKVRQASDIIARQVEHMTGLVDDLLDVSRVTRGLIKLDSGMADLHDIVAGAVEQVGALIDARSHRLRLEVPDHPLPILGDHTRLVQVFANLLNNAAKYTPEGGVIALRLEQDNGMYMVSVRDNGVGIEPKLIPHIFDLFTQAERSPDRSQGGLGLGLALVRSLVDLHGGSVAARSEGPAKGSEFIIRLPCPPGVMTEARPPEEPEVSAAARHGLRVMVVDDNVDAAESLALLLETEGHQVAVGHVAEDALAMMSQDAPQVFLLDIGLPDMDGYELARRLRAQAGTPRPLLVALTGYGQLKDQEKSRAAGFDHHLVKPADIREVMALLAGFAAQQSGTVDSR
ncbi:ATP-binding protein [Noviherbaspirillum sp. CPCC 100848]|uniref:histidine kinase n=1 Tax=Noviherbaspirillum album TaxID=3080276 RepID=A0ABU6J4Q2_9BURK|nr:ATP-binding protein [Noviherbaspirillum sp. CPCC 100848]MEC4718597.1 ATP-binding protein [Noviherbaspirillum sp. CPCC 100848]